MGAPEIRTRGPEAEAGPCPSSGEWPLLGLGSEGGSWAAKYEGLFARASRTLASPSGRPTPPCFWSAGPLTPRDSVLDVQSAPMPTIPSSMFRGPRRLQDLAWVYRPPQHPYHPLGYRGLRPPPTVFSKTKFPQHSRTSRYE